MRLSRRRENRCAWSHLNQRDAILRKFIYNSFHPLAFLLIIAIEANACIYRDDSASKRILSNLPRQGCVNGVEPAGNRIAGCIRRLPLTRDYSSPMARSFGVCWHDAAFPRSLQVRRSFRGDASPTAGKVERQRKGSQRFCRRRLTGEGTGLRPSSGPTIALTGTILLRP